MKKISWITYGIIMALLHLGGAAVSVSNGAPIPLLALGTLMMMIYLTGLYGYVFEFGIRNRKTWQVIPWIMAVGLIFDTFRSINHDGLLIALVPTLLAVPLLYALLRYGYWSNYIWGIDVVPVDGLDERA